MAGGPRRRDSIKDVFYETRVLLGREYTIRRFANEVLGRSIDPVMLGYIEKGKRFPSEALVRRLAAVRKEDPDPLLALLWRDRMIYAFGKELSRVLRAPRAVMGVDDAELAVVVSQAIAALPDDGSWVPTDRWRREFRAGGRGRARKKAVPETIGAHAEDILRQRDLIEVRGTKTRRRGRHFEAKSTEERQTLALEFCALFAKGLLDKLLLEGQPADDDQPRRDTGTYLRNHYLNIEPERLPEFQHRLDELLRKLAEEFAADASTRTRFLNILVTSTPF